ncbi:MAG: OsmC family protein [Phycisphaeraceae bacterium]|nr:OsmC family protein [Phycisphaeraceae bacterium]
MQTTQTIVNGIDTDRLKRLVADVSRDHRNGIAFFGVTTRWRGGAVSETEVNGWELGGRRLRKDFSIRIDEPPELCGTNTAPNPQEYLLAAMNACIMATFVAGCALNGIELESLEIESEGELDLRGFLGIDAGVKPGYDELRYTIRVKGSGTPEQFEKVHRAVVATSPNYFNMANPIRLNSRLEIE